MTLQDLTNFPAQFALVFFRLAGLMITAPLLGSGRIPRTIKFYFAAVLTLAMAGSLPAAVVVPDEPWLLALGIAGEIAFGLALGLVLSLVFVAAQFAGAIAGQQMGFNLAGTFNPQNEFGNAPLSDLYFVLTLLLFLAMDGHHAMLLGVRNSFDHLPPLSVGVDRDLFELFVGTVMAATTLAVRIAAPVSVAMLVVDLSLGMVGKTIPQMNLLSVGLSLRSLAGMVIVILGLALTATVLGRALGDAVTLAENAWMPPATP